jgi:folate-dependent phosphoribosylglycinamide formyltransferase PurN
MARALAKSGFLAGLVIEQREIFVPEPPQDLTPKTLALYMRHFAGREEAETRIFGGLRFPDIQRHNVEVSELNTAATVSFINRIKPDLVLSYGVHKLTPETLSNIDCKLKWNIHGGLSPWYRGVITHFWPSYFLEPQMTGMTVHELTQNIDGGDLIHQTVAELRSGDGVHDLACRAVMSLGEELPELMTAVIDNHLISPLKQATTGRIWRGADWQPAHLHLVYDYYDNRIVDRYLKGDFDQKTPKLFRQFRNAR